MTRQEEIRAVAARLFREKGFRRTSLEEIARRLRITKPALYHYIDSKYDLLYAICESAVTELLDGAREIESSPLPAEEKLRRLIALHLDMFARHGDITNVYLADEGELPPRRRRKVRALSREYETVLRGVLEEGMREGSFREMDVPMVARAVSGMCNWLSSWYDPAGERSTGEIAEVFSGLVLEGCRKREDNSRTPGKRRVPGNSPEGDKARTNGPGSPGGVRSR
ncbi:MAG: TetR/AcrR family transcriptional regulator [Actinobacteria bacterium]|nr:TetR/AcrR family transcriptional regulator [Actinomycetota bacterium]